MLVSASRMELIKILKTVDIIFGYCCFVNFENSNNSKLFRQNNFKTLSFSYFRMILIDMHNTCYYSNVRNDYIGENKMEF